MLGKLAPERYFEPNFLLLIFFLLFLLLPLDPFLICPRRAERNHPVGNRFRRFVELVQQRADFLA